MTFTPLHRVLGLQPSDLTDEILNAAITAGIEETDDIDWKSEFPAIKGITQGDVPKDIAAMANANGGIIVYGVTETAKAAAGRQHVQEFGENEERAYRSAAVSAISPPIFGLDIFEVGADLRAIAVIVPASVDGPHLIYRNDYFGAPIRNGADTVWMRERQIEAMYRARFDEQRRSTEAVDDLYAETSRTHATPDRAWLVAVAHPRIPGVLARPNRDEARAIFEHAHSITGDITKGPATYPLNSVDRLNPRPGLRRWTAPNASTGNLAWREAWIATHYDGSVTLAAAIGGHRKSADGYFEPWEVEARGIEAAVADFTALVRATAEALRHSEYEVQVGIEWPGDEPLQIFTIDGQGFTYDGVTTPLRVYTPVRSTIDFAAPHEDFHRQARQLAEDCVNQGGITNLHVIRPVLDPAD